MRVRAVVPLVVLLLLPAVTSAQRFPLPGTGRRRPAQPAPLPPQPDPIAREMEYRRWRLSVESYPLISYIRSPGLTSGGRGATVLGAGTRAEYRLTPYLLATADLTTSQFESPVSMQTAELGVRVRAERSERRLDPFVDFRVGYISANDGILGSILDGGLGVPTGPGVYGAHYSTGVGGVVGVGAEYALSRKWSLTTGGAIVQSRMTAREFFASGPVDPHFGMTSFRYTIGVRYNPVRMILRSEAEHP